MTYLTQAMISYEIAAKQRFRDVYDWHQAVWKAFPNRDGEQRDFLTRLDERAEGFRLLVVSPEIPNRPDWCPTDSWQTKPIPETYFGKRRYAYLTYREGDKVKTRYLGAEHAKEVAAMRKAMA